MTTTTTTAPANDGSMKTPIWQFKSFFEWVKTVMIAELIQPNDKCVFCFWCFVRPTTKQTNGQCELALAVLQLIIIVFYDTPQSLSIARGRFP